MYHARIRDTRSHTFPFTLTRSITYKRRNPRADLERISMTPAVSKKQSMKSWIRPSTRRERPISREYKRGGSRGTFNYLRYHAKDGR